MTILCLPDRAWPAQTNRYVAPGNPVAAPPFDSWTNAATNIGDAVALANLNSAGDIVWVSNGTYVLTGQISVTNCKVRAWTNNPPGSKVIINGNWPNTTNRCFYLNNANAELDSLVISNGYAADAALAGNGGGVYLNNGKVYNCTIVANTATNQGGGLACNNSAGRMTNCIVSANVSSNTGGGIALIGGGSIWQCTISSNASKFNGGGVWGYSTVTWISNCTIVANTCLGGAGGGGIYVDQPYSGSVIRDCVFSQNVSAARGGGIEIFNGGSMLLLDCTFDNNRCGSGYYGGGALIQSYHQVEGCTFRNNFGGNRGGGVYLNYPKLGKCIVSGNTCALEGGGIYANLYGVISNTLVCLNTSSNSGGGVYIVNTDPASPSRIESCTIAGNTAVTNRGGGIYNASGTNVLVNSLVYLNSAGGSGTNWYGAAAGQMYLTNCCLMPTNGLIVDNTITNDPRFRNPALADYRLGPGSPCINAGTNLPWMNGAYDLDGRTRVRYGRVDIGAYEAIYSGAIMTLR